jgi:hypothetical protein
MNKHNFVNIIFIIFLSFLTFISKSQNIVRNGSFEDIKIITEKNGKEIKFYDRRCIDSIYWWDYSKDRKYAGENVYPHIFNFKESEWQPGDLLVKDTINGKICLEVCFYPGCGTLRSQLSESLLKDSIYLISMYVHKILGGTACMKYIPIYLTNKYPSTEVINNNNNIKLINEDGNDIIESEKWIKLICEYKANGEEKYLQIGEYDKNKYKNVWYKCDLSKQFLKDHIVVGTQGKSTSWYFIDKIEIKLKH